MVGSWSFALAKPSLSDDIAYAFARALDQAQETTSRNTFAAAPSAALIHPGVIRYLKEVGVAR